MILAEPIRVAVETDIYGEIIPPPRVKLPIDLDLYEDFYFFSFDLTPKGLIIKDLYYQLLSQI